MKIGNYEIRLCIKKSFEMRYCCKKLKNAMKILDDDLRIDTLYPTIKIIQRYNRKFDTWNDDGYSLITHHGQHSSPKHEKISYCPFCGEKK